MVVNGRVNGRDRRDGHGNGYSYDQGYSYCSGHGFGNGRGNGRDSGRGIGYGYGYSNGKGYIYGHGFGNGRGNGFDYGFDHGGVGGSKGYHVKLLENRILSIGCEAHTIAYWLENWLSVAEDRGVSHESALEYYQIILAYARREGVS